MGSRARSALANSAIGALRGCSRGCSAAGRTTSWVSSTRHFPPSAAIRRAAPPHAPPPARAAADPPVRMCTIRLPTHPCACARSFSQMLNETAIIAKHGGSKSAPVRHGSALRNHSTGGFSDCTTNDEIPARRGCWRPPRPSSTSSLAGLRLRCRGNKGGPVPAHWRRGRDSRPLSCRRVGVRGIGVILRCGPLAPRHRGINRNKVKVPHRAAATRRIFRRAYAKLQPIFPRCMPCSPRLRWVEGS
jgi:hypothetical protein